MKSKIKYQPKSLWFGSTKLNHGIYQNTSPQPDGVHRINNTCIELETYLNLTQSGSAGFIGLSFLASLVTSIIYAYIFWPDIETLIAIAAVFPAMPIFGAIIYFSGRGHRYRGAYIRINRITRKLYFVPPEHPDRMIIIDWDKIEGLAGFIPIVSSHSYTSRHPLYLTSINHATNPPEEICLACGNSGFRDGGTSACSLWAYLQYFMMHGQDGLPPVLPRTPSRNRIDAALEPYREWMTEFREQHCKPSGWLWSPLTIPVSIVSLILHVYPSSVEAWIQYNVPYAKFPHSNDVLCGFAEKRKAVIRVNGVKLDQ